MSKKYSTTTADFLEWAEMVNLVHKLAKDKKFKMSLLIAVGSFWGLRISDILNLKWEDILDKEEFSLSERKTGKRRIIRINTQLRIHIKECYDNIRPRSLEENILISQKGSIYSIQRINMILKELKFKYKLNIKNISSHSLRKTFGREVYNQNSENSEMALVKLMELFNHSSIMITKRYLGLRQEELLETYDNLSF